MKQTKDCLTGTTRIFNLSRINLNMRAIILPGNCNTDISSNWYLSVKKEMENLGFHVTAQNMPDADLARRQHWLPFISSKEPDVLIGHSSGVVAILRYLEDHKAEGAVLVGAYYTDLDDEKERLSGYFDVPWQWEKIKQNVRWVVIFASTDDRYINIEEPRFIAKMLNAEYHEYSDEGHFGSPYEEKTEFSEIIEAVRRKMK